MMKRYRHSFHSHQGPPVPTPSMAVIEQCHEVQQSVDLCVVNIFLMRLFLLLLYEMSHVMKVKPHCLVPECESHTSIISIRCSLFCLHHFWRKSRGHSAARMKSTFHFISIPSGSIQLSSDGHAYIKKLEHSQPKVTNTGFIIKLTESEHINGFLKRFWNIMAHSSVFVFVISAFISAPVGCFKSFILSIYWCIICRAFVNSHFIYYL